MIGPRLPSFQLALTWCATGIALNAIEMTERAAAGLPLIDPPLFWTLLRWGLWIVLVPPIVLVAQGTRAIAFHVAGATAASFAHTALFAIARILSGVHFGEVLLALRDRFWLDVSHDVLIYVATVGAYYGGSFLAERRAIAIEEKRLEAARADADARAIRNRLRPESISEALTDIASFLPHDKDCAEESLDNLAQSVRRRIAKPAEGRVPLSETAETSFPALSHLRLALVGAVVFALGGLSSLTIVGSMTVAAAAFVVVDAGAAHRRRVRSLEIRQRCAEAESRFLRARLEPHFLFNSLNSVAALIETDRDLAKSMLDNLREFYDSASSAHAGEITIAEELALVQRYLFVESIRFRDRMRVSIECEPSIRTTFMPSLLLQPLVENAVRHGIARRTAPGEMCIRFVREEHTIRATVMNDLADDDDNSDDLEGDGLALTRARLRTAYGTGGSFQVQRAAGKFRIEMTWPCA